MQLVSDTDANALHAPSEREALPLTGTAPLGPQDSPRPVVVPGAIVFHQPSAIVHAPTAVAVAGRIVFHQRTRAMLPATHRIAC